MWEGLWEPRLEVRAGRYGVRFLFPPPQAGSWESLAWKPASSTGVSVSLVLDMNLVGRSFETTVFNRNRRWLLETKTGQAPS